MTLIVIAEVVFLLGVYLIIKYIILKG